MKCELSTFLAEDNNRSLYYRPSLNYFFGHVWLAERDLFLEDRPRGCYWRKAPKQCPRYTSGSDLPVG